MNASRCMQCVNRAAGSCKFINDFGLSYYCECITYIGGCCVCNLRTCTTANCVNKVIALYDVTYV